MSFFNFNVLICFYLFFLTINLKAEQIFTDRDSLLGMDKFLVFTNLFVFHTESENEMLLANIFYASTVASIKKHKRFNIFDKTNLTEELLKSGLTNVDLNKKDEIISRSDHFDLNGFIQPIIKRIDNKINLILNLLDRDGKTFASEEIEDFSYLDREKFDQTVNTLVEKLISHIPYMGLIYKIENDLIFVNIGTESGLNQNDVLRVFEIKRIKKHPLLKTIIDFEKEPIGRLVVVEAKENYSITKTRSIKPGSIFKLFMKIDKSTIAKDPFLYPEPVKTYNINQNSTDITRYSSSFGSLEVRCILGYFKHVSTSDNIALNQTVNSFLFPELMFLGDIWLTSKIILGTVVQGMVVTIKDKSMTPTSVNGMLNNFSFLFKYRFIIGDSIHDPQIIPAIGLYRYSFSPDKTEPIIITGKTYYGLSMGGQLIVPIEKKYSLNFRGMVNPYPKLKETPLESGIKKSTLGYMFDIGLSYAFNDKISLNSGIKVDTFRTDFSGTSPRNTPNATSSLVSSGIYIGTRINF